MPNYNTAICMRALHQSGNSDHTPLVLKAREYIASTQYIGDNDKYNGAWGYGRQGKRPKADLLNTFYSLEAISATASVEEFREGKRVTVDKEAAAAQITALQNPASAGEQAGGFNYKPTGQRNILQKITGSGPTFRSYGSLTYAGTLALMHSDVPHDDERVISAMKWARKHWTLDENPGMGENGLYFFYRIMSKCLAASGIDDMELEDGTVVKWRDSVTTKLLSLSRKTEDGQTYWVNDTGRWWENDPVLVTSYAILTLDIAKN